MYWEKSINLTNHQHKQMNIDDVKKTLKILDRKNIYLVYTRKFIFQRLQYL